MTTNCLSQKDLEIISKNFLSEIEKSEKGEKTSLNFITHELSFSLPVEINENFQVLVIGGSILKKGLLKKTKNGIEIVRIENEKNIYFKNTDDFLNLISEELYPDISTFVLNFAYPLRPIFEDGNLDGILLAASKEGKFKDMVGKQIGKIIKNHILVKTNKKIRVSVANDIVCLLASGLTKFQAKKLAAGIVGTGINTAFFIDNKKLVNLESRNFNKFPQTETGKAVDEASSQPGSDLFEKETAGHYLYRHFNYILKASKISYPELESTEELDKISRMNIPQISEIALNLLRRSAQFVACQIAGIVRFKKKDMNFVMEGSLFWKGNNYKQTITKTVKELSPNYKANFVEIKNSAIIGAAELIG